MKYCSATLRVLKRSYLLFFLSILIFSSCSDSSLNSKYPQEVRLASKEFGAKIKVVTNDFQYHILDMKRIQKFYTENAPHFDNELLEINESLPEVSEYYYKLYEGGHDFNENVWRRNYCLS